MLCSVKIRHGCTRYMQDGFFYYLDEDDHNFTYAVYALMSSIIATIVLY